MDLFGEKETESGKGQAHRPLADRMRPKNLGEFVGQLHLLGEDGLLRHAIASDRLVSMIFWGPPGSGKTTLARLIAAETKSHFETFSAVLSGVKDIRAVIEEAKAQLQQGKKRSSSWTKSTVSTRPNRTPSFPTWKTASSP